jgi:hypothetical protein
VSAKRIFGSLGIGLCILWASGVSQQTASAGGSFVEGTEIGNARFVDYVSPLYGVSFQYPEEWNVVDLGDALNVIGAPLADGSAGALESASSQRKRESFSSLDHVEIVFNTENVFPSFIAFERWVKNQEPQGKWGASLFLGKHALQWETSDAITLYVLKNRDTVMRLRYPLEHGTRQPSALVQKTVASLSFFK